MTTKAQKTSAARNLVAHTLYVWQQAKTDADRTKAYDAFQAAAVAARAAETEPDEVPKPTAHDFMAPMRLGFQADDNLEMPKEGAGQAFAVNLAGRQKMRTVFDHERIPANCAMRANAAGVVSEAFLQKLDVEIEQSMATFERTILDPLHHFLLLKGDRKYAEYNDDKTVVGMTIDQHYERATAIWVQLAKRYKDHSLRLGFDLFNEPGIGVLPGGHNAARYHAWLPVVIPAIRATGGLNADRTLAIEPWGAVENTVIPPNAGNVVHSPHCYDPGNYTHGTATLTPAGMSAFLMNMRRYKAFAERTGVPVWIGEMGAPFTKDGRPEYLQFVRETSLTLGLSGCYWGYKHVFAHVNMKGEWLPGVLDALTGKGKVRPIPEQQILTGGRLQNVRSREAYERSVTWDAKTGKLNLPANTTGADQPVVLVFPEIPVDMTQSWAIRMADTSRGMVKVGVMPMLPGSPSDSRAIQIKEGIKHYAWQQGAGGGTPVSFAPLKPLPGAVLSASLTVSAGFPGLADAQFLYVRAS